MTDVSTSPSACRLSCRPAGHLTRRPGGFDLVTGRRAGQSPREMLMPFDWHPVTDTNATAAKANVTVAN